MSPVDELLDKFQAALSASRDRLGPGDRATLDASSLKVLMEGILSLRSSTALNLTGGGAPEVQQALSLVGQSAESAYARAEREERGQRHNDLLFPPDEQRFESALRWAYARGGQETLVVLNKVREAPVFSSGDVLELLAKAEKAIRKRLGLPLSTELQPLPETVRHAAAFYLQYKLGDALVAEGAGTLARPEGSPPTWHVKVYIRESDELRGELHISEDGSKVLWFPAPIL